MEKLILQKFGGTGLGLAISKHLVELLDGSIKYSPRDHNLRGSIFTVTLPIQEYPVSDIGTTVPPPKVSPSTPIEQMSDSNTCGVKVLVVDDNLINIKVFDKMLKDLKVEHVCVTSGEEALSMFAQQSFNLVLMDIEVWKISKFFLHIFTNTN